MTGGPLCKVEPIFDPQWKHNVELWEALNIGCFTKFIQWIMGHDQHISLQFVAN